MISRYRLKIQGKNLEYFVRKLVLNQINIYDLEKNAHFIIVEIDQSDYEKVLNMKTIYQVELVGRVGISKYTYWFSKYFLFLICFVLGIVLNIFLSHLIFDVEIIHSNQEILELVRSDLEDAGISKFHFKVSYSKKEQIVEDILEKETNDLEWLEIEEVGTKYVVKVEQRKKNKDKITCSPQNIVAKKDSMILQIQADSGEVVKKKLDYVKKGDIIISGLIHNKEEVVSKKCALGTVYGEVWYKVNLSLPKQYIEENVTGRSKKQLEIRFLNSVYQFFHHFKTYQKREYSILQTPLFPIQLNLVEYLETTVKKKNYTLLNVDQDAISLAEEKLKDKLFEDSKILSKNVLKKEEKDSKIIVEVFFKVKENITDFQDITNVNIDEINSVKE